MSWFRRSSAPADTALEDPVSQEDLAPAGQPEAPAEVSDRTNGPWDVSEVTSTQGYVDLGGIWLMGRDGMEVRLDVDTATDTITSITVLLDGSAAQLQAFAAPRSGGTWAEIRSEIAEGIRSQGIAVDEVPGAFGYELLAQLPARDSSGATVAKPTRFVGIEGPRWFLRAVLHGKAAYDEEAAAQLESFVRDIAVVRGPDPMAPREMLPLRAPQMADDTHGGQAAEETDGEGEGERYQASPFERGPEITEIR